MFLKIKLIKWSTTFTVHNKNIIKAKAKHNYISQSCFQEIKSPN